MRFIHEYTPSGRHRLIGVAPDGRRWTSDLVGYQGIAKITSQPYGDYFVTTDYWTGTFVADFVYKVQAHSYVTPTILNARETTEIA